MKTKMLCPECQTVSTVTESNRITNEFTLDCGHTRADLLPAKGISAEHAYLPIGKTLFPAVWDSEKSAQRPYREDWQ